MCFIAAYQIIPPKIHGGLDNTKISDMVAKRCGHDSIIYTKSHMGDLISKFDFSKLSESVVIKVIKYLKRGISAGYDGIQDTFLTSRGANLATSLCFLFTSVCTLGGTLNELC